MSLTVNIASIDWTVGWREVMLGDRAALAAAGVARVLRLDCRRHCFNGCLLDDRSQANLAS
jgi:hypothetical protein